MKRLVKKRQKQQVEYPRESLREVAISGIRLIKTKSSRQGNKLDTSTRHGTPNISSRPLPSVINKNERNSPFTRLPTRPIFLPIPSVPTKLLDTSIISRVQTHVHISEKEKEREVHIAFNSVVNKIIITELKCLHNKKNIFSCDR